MKRPVRMTSTMSSAMLSLPMVMVQPCDSSASMRGLRPRRAAIAALKATIVREGGHLVVTFPFRPQPLALEPISETEFDMPSTDGRFTFRKDQAGRVTGVLFRIGDGERDMRRVAP